MPHCDHAGRRSSGNMAAPTIWIMDDPHRGDAGLDATPVRYLVGTPKGRLTRLEKAFLGRPWQEVRQSVEVKLTELYEGRLLKERGMRRRRLISCGDGWASCSGSPTAGTS